MRLLEQAAILGALDRRTLEDAARAADTARYVARRLDALEAPADRGWLGAALPDGGLVFTRTLRGVGERHVIDAHLIDSIEARRLSEKAGSLQKTYEKPGTLTVKGKSHPIDGPVQLIDTVVELGRKGVAIQRYKGLGEMNPDQLWQTTLDPNARTLLQVHITHTDDAEEVFSTLMGDTVETRREFIETNALKVENLDVLTAARAPIASRSPVLRQHRFAGAETAAGFGQVEVGMILEVREVLQSAEVAAPGQAEGAAEGADPRPAVAVPRGLAADQRHDIEGETEVVPGIAGSGVGDALAGPRPPLGVDLRLFLVSTERRRNQQVNALVLGGDEQRPRQLRHVRIEVLQPSRPHLCLLKSRI